MNKILGFSALAIAAISALIWGLTTHQSKEDPREYKIIGKGSHHHGGGHHHGHHHHGHHHGHHHNWDNHWNHGGYWDGGYWKGGGYIYPEGGTQYYYTEPSQVVPYYNQSGQHHHDHSMPHSNSSSAPSGKK